MNQLCGVQPAKLCVQQVSVRTPLPVAHTAVATTWVRNSSTTMKIIDVDHEPAC